MTDTITLTHAAESPAALLDVRTLAALLDVSARSVYRLADGGLVPRPVRLGSLVRWSRAEIDNWISADPRPVDADQDEGP